ncbi:MULTISPECIES: hypothetical protein [Salimicrobium]|uniref:DUF4190 domain-containing protein n=4 Tax=Salimicrobium TaxID=351195 RepID=A0AAC9BC75_9BACI|nr:MULTISPECIES: hypothetical protein [Salimicrobium]ANC70223.1 hypothetical protein AAV35_008725 [Salimicrobium jeotgali]MBM7696361.1 putative membrane protein [Salimicrobium jeotgali]PBB06532.1 hypothetical protein CKW00_02470 [Salimicrobium humidisoli]SDX41872.1 hypothetical protein SAMN04488081_0457 [Salimicrobium album]SIS46042.1 hypothetical protein SAMN05421758_101253 [Salimicrobium salexigens]
MKEIHESKAVTSMVLGLISLPVPLIGWLLGIFAVAYARPALKSISYDNPKRWYAVTGMVCGILGIVMDVSIVLIALIIFFFL